MQIFLPIFFFGFWSAEGEAISWPQLSSHRFNVNSNRRVRLIKRSIPANNAFRIIYYKRSFGFTSFVIKCIRRYSTFPKMGMKEKDSGLRIGRFHRYFKFGYDPTIPIGHPRLLLLYSSPFPVKSTLDFDTSVHLLKRTPLVLNCCNLTIIPPFVSPSRVLLPSSGPDSTAHLSPSLQHYRLHTLISISLNISSLDLMCISGGMCVSRK